MSSPLVFHHPMLRSAANALYASNTATSAIHPESSSSSSPLGSSLHDRHLSSSSSLSPMSQVLPSSSSSSSLSLSVTAPAAASPRLCTQSNHLSSTQSSSLSLSNSSSPVRTTVCCEIDELLESGLSLEKAMIAGAVAGVTEHVSMFPLDTIKTRMQVLLPKGSKYSSISQTIGRIYHEEGFFRLYRGVTAVVAAAIPSHAVHYASYEFAKAQLGANQAGHRPLETAVAGSIATMAHDAVVTPLDVIKQRMQMFNSQYISVKAAASRILREEGIRGFYASYPTTVAMNIPFVSVYFTAYESMKLVLTHQRQHHTETEGVKEHLIAGGISGASAGFISTPFDVVKTRLQTQHAVIANGIQREIHVGALGMFRRIWTAEGFRGFFKGASARMLYNTPSAAICWTTYETLKNALRDAW